MAAKTAAQVVPITSRRSNASEYADREAAAEAAHEMEEQHIDCRLITHQWAWWRVLDEKNEYGQFKTVVLRCRSCKSTRTIVRGRRGDAAGNRIRYANGYLTKGVGRIVGDAKDALWEEKFNRLDSKPKRGRGNT